MVRKDGFRFPFILGEPQGQGGRSGKGNIENFQNGRDIHFQPTLTQVFFAEVEDQLDFGRFNIFEERKQVSVGFQNLDGMT